MPSRDLIRNLDLSSLSAHTSTELGRVYAFDCLDVLAEMPDASLDLCVTSPPYERQPKYGNGERYERDWFETTFMEIAGEIRRVLKPSGQFVLNYRSRREGAARSTLQYELVFWLKEQGWIFAEDHIWIKPSPPPGKYKRALKDAIEYCFRFAKTDEFELYPDQCLMPARWDAKDRERRKRLGKNHKRVDAPSGHGRNRVQAGPDWVAPSNAIVTEPEFSPNPSRHPARFPPAIPEFFIKLCTRPGASVFDPFAGTSTAGIVAEALGREWVMAELDSNYCDVVPGRLADLAKRMERLADLPPDAAPEGVRTVPLPFALPAPKVSALPRRTDEFADRIDLKKLG